MLLLRNRHLFLIDLILLPAAVVVAFALRLDATGMLGQSNAVFLYMAIAVPVKLIAFYFFGLYRRFWRYASVDELVLILAGTGASMLVIGGAVFGLLLPLTGLGGFPRSIPLIDGLLTLLAVGGPRFAVRLVDRGHLRRQRKGQCTKETRVLVMGAGEAGALIAREMWSNPQLGFVPVGFLDDDERKRGSWMHRIPVLGTREDIPRLVQEYEVDQVIIAMPTASGQAIRQIVAICQEAGVVYKTIPGVYDLISGRVGVQQVREVRIEDLLRREPVQIDGREAERYLSGAVVLVTGAGGSIGAELCRQVASHGPSRLLLLGHGENSIYHIHMELRQRYPRLAIETLIADVRDHDRLMGIFEQHKPEIVFHAAAHKHVPLMESNVSEAVANNVFGTLSVLQASEAGGVSRFVLVSTDKAVEPVNVMGATKRLAELLVQDAARRSGRNYVAVRFGNVLGSRGSVVPVFQEQIAAGGPVTVTHPEMSRFFMTIPEAVQLVIQATALGEGGEVFVLDMGDQVRIVDLAMDLIKLSGLEPHHDIEIAFTGVRPGEKLNEALFAEEESPYRTLHSKIFVAHGNHIESGEVFAHHLQELEALIKQGKEKQICAKLQEIVPGYRPNGTGNNH